MNFASDNIAGASDRVVDAIAAANSGPSPAYANDDLTRAVEAKFAEVFERPVGVLLVSTGTAANALAISSMTPSWATVLCHRESHIRVDECGAVGFYGDGISLLGLDGRGAKLNPATVRDALAGNGARKPHQSPARTLSLTQATEYGLVYSVDEVGVLADVATSAGLRVHVDGARFANALVSQNALPADLTWRAGVDILSFGATKNGTFAAEALIVFDDSLMEELVYRRMRAGHLLSKHRLLAAQLSAYLTDDHWLDLARHANAMAAELARTMNKSSQARLALPVEANELFVILSDDVDRKLRDAGAFYHAWPGHPGGDEAVGDGERLYRFVTSFATTQNDIANFAAALNT